MIKAYLIGLVLVGTGWAQESRIDTSRHFLRINGSEIIHHYIPNGMVAAELLFRRSGSVYAPPGKEALSILALATIFEAASRRLTPNRLYEALARHGVTISYFATPEYVGVRWSYPKESQEFLVELFTELFVHPTFDSQAFANAKWEIASRIHQRNEEIDVQLMEQVYRKMASLFDYPYRSPYGRLSALDSLTLDEVRQHYYTRLLNASAIVLAIVGDRPYIEVKKWANRVLPRIPRRVALPPKANSMEWAIWLDHSRLYRFPVELSPSMLYVTMGVMAPFHPDYTPLMLAYTAFYDRIELGKYSLDYLTVRPLPSSEEEDGMQFPYDVLGFRLHSPLPEMGGKQFFDLLVSWQRNGISEVEVASARSLLLTLSAAEHWSNANLAHSYAHYQVLWDDWRIPEKFLQRLRLISAVEVNKVIRRRLKGIWWFYFGSEGLLQDTSVFYFPLNVNR